MMVKCEECGAVNEETAGFCKKCGVQLRSSGVVNRGGKTWRAGRILSLFLGCFVLIISLGFFAGGGAVLWSQNALAADDGYIYTGSIRLSTDSYAVVQHDIHPKVENGWWPSIPIKDIVSVRVKATSNNGKPVFVGIATKQSALAYFDGVNVDGLVWDNWVPRLSVLLPQTLTYQSLPGGSPSTPPTSQFFWVAQASGTGVQTMDWMPSTGEYWLVVMNADGSKVLNANVQIGARLTLFNWTAWGMVIVGILAALGGIAIIYFGAIRRN
jgi:hypothetical protein